MNRNRDRNVVTKAKLAAKLGIDKKRVQQFGAKQLFIVDTGEGGCLYSYYTKVGVRVNNLDNWLLTTRHYSRTTSRQLKWFSQYNTIIGYGAI